MLILISCLNVNIVALIEYLFGPSMNKG